MNQETAVNQYKAHTFNIEKLGLHVKRIGNNIADVFSGEGFSIPSRLRVVKGTWMLVSGPKLSATEQQQVLAGLK